jgi:hypothetical protein
MAAVRTTTPLNLLRESVLTSLAGINHRKNSAYITTPKTVKRLAELGDFTGAQKPIVALGVTSAEFEPQTAQRFDGKIMFAVHCMTESKRADPEGDLLDLVSDVILALAANVTVGGQAIYLFPRSFEPNVDLIARSGLAVTTVIFECMYRFDSTAP